MDDLISRAEVLDVLVTSPNFHTTLTRIEELPAVDAVPVIHARWEKSDTGLWQSCSECGVAVEVQSMYMCKASEDENFNFCTHCGAKMDGERRDDDGKAN